MTNKKGTRKDFCIFTEYQRWMWYFLSQTAVCRFYVDRTENGGFIIKNIGKLALLFYWFMWVNTVIKGSYLLLTYHGWLGIEVHFLDQMSMWDWYLIFGNVTFETMTWCRREPLYEIFYRQWQLQEEIWNKLGRPESVSKKINWTDRFNVYLYSSISVAGSSALAIQFFRTPKYALNTYAIVPESWDNLFLQVIFCIHECLFMYHAYLYQASMMVIGQCFSVSFQHLLEEMNSTLQNLMDVDLTEGHAQTGESEGQSANFNDASKKDKYMSKRTLAPDAIAEGTTYDILGLIMDYKKIIIAANAHNRWIGRFMGCAQGCNYAQFVSDVFLLIQLLKEPDTDMLGVFFYGLDACFGMFMLFRMLIVMSRLVPPSDEFIQGLKLYAMYDTPLRKVIMKYIPTLRRITAKFVGYSIRPESVPNGINLLINWYICAAMWKRPDDPSRRT